MFCLIANACSILGLAASRLPLAEAAPGAGGTPGATYAAAPSFQAYIFWAFGLACLFILLFTLWTMFELKLVGKKIDYLSERFERAHPGAIPPDDVL